MQDLSFCEQIMLQMYLFVVIECDGYDEESTVDVDVVDVVDVDVDISM